MLSERLKNSIKNYPDFPKKGIIFRDITPILYDAELFSCGKNIKLWFL